MENFESKEKKEFQWENLSEVQKEVLASQFGINDAETLEFVLSPDEVEVTGEGKISSAEAAELVRQALKDFA